MLFTTSVSADKRKIINNHAKTDFMPKKPMPVYTIEIKMCLLSVFSLIIPEGSQIFV